MPERIYELSSGTLIDLKKICFITKAEYYDGPEDFIFEIHFIGSRNVWLSKSGILHSRHSSRQEADGERVNIRQAWEKCLKHTETQNAHL